MHTLHLVTLLTLMSCTHLGSDSPSRVVVSLQNQSNTGSGFSQVQLQKAISARDKARGREALVSRLSLMALGAQGWADLDSTVFDLSAIDFAKSKQLGEDARYALGIAAVRLKRFALANDIFDDLRDSRRKDIRAGAWNGKGVMAIYAENWPEAGAFFEKALAEDPGELAAQENWKALKSHFGLPTTDGG